MWEGKEYMIEEIHKNGFLWNLKASLDHRKPVIQKGTTFTWKNI